MFSVFKISQVMQPAVVKAPPKKKSAASASQEKKEVRCIFCDRIFGDQPGDARIRCSLKRSFKLYGGGTVVLGPLIHEVLGVDLESKVTAEERKELMTCLCCANKMMKVKMKRKELLEAEESLRSFKGENGYIGRMTRFKRFKSRKQQLPSDIPSIFQEDDLCLPSKRKRQSGETSGSGPPSPTPSCASASSDDAQDDASALKMPRPSFRQDMSRAIVSCKYKRAFKTAFSKSSVARRHFLDTVTFLGNQQMMKFRRNKQLTSLNQEFNADTVENFNWGPIMAELREHLPILCAAVVGSLTTRPKREKVDFEGESMGELVPGMGIVLAMITNMRSPHMFKFIPALLGMCLYKYGCRSMLINNLSRTGFCYTAATIRRLIKRHGKMMNCDILFELKAGEMQRETDSEFDSEEDESDEESDEETDGEEDGGESDSEEEAEAGSDEDAGGDSEADGESDGEAESESGSPTKSPAKTPAKTQRKTPAKTPSKPHLLKTPSAEQPDGPTG